MYIYLPVTTLWHGKNENYKDNPKIDKKVNKIIQKILVTLLSNFQNKSSIIIYFSIWIIFLLVPIPSTKLIKLKPIVEKLPYDIIDKETYIKYLRSCEKIVEYTLIPHSNKYKDEICDCYIDSLLIKHTIKEYDSLMRIDQYILSLYLDSIIISCTKKIVADRLYQDSIRQVTLREKYSVNFDSVLNEIKNNDN